jgi:DNA-binding response OmpR family regulator
MRQRVLLIDDSAFILEVLEAAFEREGYEVAAAVNLQQLEDHIAQKKPDLVILDVQMPEAFGDDVAQILKHVRDVRVPMLLFSNLPGHVLEVKARDAEIDGWVTKGDGIPTLLEKARALLRSA